MFRSPFDDFDNDPIFSMHRQHMQRMQQMMSDPFGMMSSPHSMLSLEDGRPHSRRSARQDQSQSLMPFDPFGAHQSMISPFGSFGMFGGMDSMMRRMNQMMSEAQSNTGGGNGQFFSQSSVMTFSSDGTGQPKVYQASSSVSQAPGGVRETRKMVRDSQSGVEKVEVGHRIGERSHVISKSRNVRTGDTEENHEFENLDEGEAESFNSEFRQRTAPYTRRRPHSQGHREIEGGSRRRNAPQAALEYPRH